MLKGIVMFRVDVGQLPPFNADAYMTKFKEENAELIKKLTEQSYATVFLKNRSGLTSIELCPLE